MKKTTFFTHFKRTAAFAAGVTLVLCLAGAFASCSSVGSTADESVDIASDPGIFCEKVEGIPSGFYFGADVSSVLALEKSGVVFKDKNGNPQDIFKTLKQNGVNPEDFEIAKREVYGDLVSSLNNVESIANALADAHFNESDIFGFIDDVAQCSADDINLRLKNMFDTDNTTLSVILPDKE